MCRPMLIPMLVLPIQRGHGGVAAGVVGVAGVVVVGAAGVGLHLTGTRGGRTTD